MSLYYINEFILLLLLLLYQWYLYDLTILFQKQCINVIYNLTQWIYLFIKWYLYGFILQFKLMNLFILMMIISIYLQWINIIILNDIYMILQWI